MCRLLRVVVVVLLTIIKIIKCELYPSFFSEQQLTEIFGSDGFNREHPYRPHTSTPRINYMDFNDGGPREAPVDMYPWATQREQNMNLPRVSPWLNYKGPGRQGATTLRPEERIFPDNEGPLQDESGRDMDELPKRLTKTNKWNEFLALVKEESKKHPKGEIMPNWEQDIEKWAGYSRQLLVRDKYQKDKALRASQELAKQVAESVTVATLPPPPLQPEPGMELYWGDNFVLKEKAITPKPSGPQTFITPHPFYTYNRPPGARRYMPGVGEPGFPIDEDPTYAGEENPRKWGAMSALRHNADEGYVGDKPLLRGGVSQSQADYSADYPIGHLSNMNLEIPGEAEYKANRGQKPDALRTGLRGVPSNNMDGFPPGYGVPGGLPSYSGSGVPPGYGGPRSPPGSGGSGVPPGYGGPKGPPGYGGPGGPAIYGGPGGLPRSPATYGGPGVPPGYGGHGSSSGYLGSGGLASYGEPGQGPSGYGGLGNQAPGLSGRSGGNTGYGGSSAPPGFTGPASLSGHSVYNPARMGLRSGSHPDYFDQETENMVRMAQAILDRDAPKENVKVDTPERVDMFQKMFAEKQNKYLQKGQLKRRDYNMEP